MDNLNQAQRERLAYIEFRLYFLGDVRRADLMTRFGIAAAAATRDFALYKSLFPANIEFDNVSKTYVIGSGFEPAFEHVQERVLMALSQGFGDGVNPVAGPMISCEVPMALNRPLIHVLAPVTRAIYSGKAVRMQYASHTSGASKREVVPFAIATDGLRWHIRAFDRKNQDFRDFVFSRMSKTEVMSDGPIARHETAASDIQWNRIVELTLVPHPDRKSSITEMDYGMQDSVLRLNLRAAMAGYVLRQWHVDCSPDHSLSDEAFRLWLSDPLALYGVGSAAFAPGYRKPS
ncbi:WYL domain-containing protein [Uliginosibacterium flavum]|uniref:WYL domain-containing protein n=1 Tax=Uliginosibacterium flavum TaxID=1396831 RepID=A0ABV2TLH3_9RHOO